MVSRSAQHVQQESQPSFPVISQKSGRFPLAVHRRTSTECVGSGQQVAAENGDPGTKLVTREGHTQGIEAMQAAVAVSRLLACTTINGCASRVAITFNVYLVRYPITRISQYSLL